MELAITLLFTRTVRNTVPAFSSIQLEISTIICMLGCLPTLWKYLSHPPPPPKPAFLICSLQPKCLDWIPGNLKPTEKLTFIARGFGSGPGTRILQIRNDMEKWVSWQKYVRGSLCKTCTQYACAVLFQLLFLFSCLFKKNVVRTFNVIPVFTKKVNRENLYEDIFLLFCKNRQNLKSGNNLTEVLLRDPQEYNLPFERKTKVQNWAVPLEKDSYWIVQCMPYVISAHWLSDYIHNKSRFGQTNLSSCRQYTMLAVFFWLHPKPPLPVPPVFFFLQELLNVSVCADSTRHSLLGDSLSRQWNYAGQDGIVTIFFRVCLQYGKSSLKQLLPWLLSGCCDLLFLCNWSFISLLPHAQFPTAALKTC